MKFLVDNQLPIELARWLEKQGIEAKHALDLQLDDKKDPLIWQYAITRDFVLISKDEDFAEWVNLRHPSPSMIWVRLGNCRNEILIAAFERAFPVIQQRLIGGEILIELY